MHVAAGGALRGGMCMWKNQRYVWRNQTKVNLCEFDFMESTELTRNSLELPTFVLACKLGRNALAWNSLRLDDFGEGSGKVRLQPSANQVLHRIGNSPQN